MNYKGSKTTRYKLLVEYAKEHGIAKSQKDFGEKLGYTNESGFSQIITCRVPEPRDFYIKLKSLVPNLNTEWLDTGNGDMFVEGHGTNIVQSGIVNGNNTQTANVSSEEIKRLVSLLEAKDKQIEKLLDIIGNQIKSEKS